jgi:hypothetical protein
LIHEVETTDTQAGELAHVALDAIDVEALALGDLAVDSQLFARRVDHRHRASERGERRPLLPAAGCQAEHVADLSPRQPPVRVDESAGGGSVDVADWL